MLRLAAAPAWLITRSVDQYDSTAFRIMSDDALRCEVSQQLGPEEVRNAILAEHQTHATDFIDTMWRVYRNRERVKGERGGVWRSDDRKGA